MNNSSTCIQYCVNCTHCCSALPRNGEEEFACRYFDWYIQWSIDAPNDCAHFKKDVNLYLRERCE